MKKLPTGIEFFFGSLFLVPSMAWPYSLLPCVRKVEYRSVKDPSEITGTAFLHLFPAQISQCASLHIKPKGIRSRRSGSKTYILLPCASPRSCAVIFPVSIAGSASRNSSLRPKNHCTIGVMGRKFGNAKCATITITGSLTTLEFCSSCYRLYLQRSQ